jgi:hypothetical protein
MRRENALHKIDTLLTALQGFRAAFDEEARLYEEQRAVARKIASGTRRKCDPC